MFIVCFSLWPQGLTMKLNINIPKVTYFNAIGPIYKRKFSILPGISTWTMIKYIFFLRIKRVQCFYRHRPSEACAVRLLTNTLAGTCVARFTRLCLNRYLRFWNQFLICSSFISRALANNARSSRVKYCWREKMSSKYSSWNCEKRLLLRFCLVISSPVVSLPRFGSSTVLLLALFSDMRRSSGQMVELAQIKAPQYF